MTPSASGNGGAPATLELVIVGNGMVSHHLCKQLIERGGDAKKARYRITVLGEEPRPAYDRVNLTEYLRGTSAESLELSPRQWYEEAGIELITGDRATAIDRRLQIVHTAGGRKVKYDRLVLATGSAPFVPKVEGVDLPHVFVYRTLEDLDAIRAAAGRSCRAAVIGGGLLGLEAARALMDVGQRVELLELANNLMPAQLEPANAAVLEERARSLGVRVHVSTMTTKITSSADGLSLHTQQGKRLIVDMIVISAGIRPRDELARASGLEVGLQGGGILVNDRLRTNDSNIYAIGECARHRGLIYGLAAPGYQMARVLAANLLGGDERFEEAELSTCLKMLGLDVAVLGDFRGGRQSVSWTSNGCRRQLLLQEGTLVGAVVVGRWAETPRVQEAIEQERRIGFRRLEKFRRTGDLWPEESATPVADWPEDAMVCSCLHVSCGAIRACMKEGAATSAVIAEKTGASTVCGSCKPIVAELAGAPAVPEPVRGSKVLLIASFIALVTAALVLLLRPMPFATSVLDSWHKVDVIWRDAFWKQFTGWTLVGIVAVALTLSLRKRIKWLAFGSFGMWRAVHALLGVLAILALAVHTGLRMGDNLNFALMLCFVGLSLVGGLAGVVTAMESRAKGRWAFRARQWRPALTLAHIVLFWPLPVLLVFHVLSAYFF